MKVHGILDYTLKKKTNDKQETKHSHFVIYLINTYNKTSKT